MDDKLERIFINFADSHEDSLSEMGLTRESFIEQACEWSETDEGKLEIQKFILQQEIVDLEKEIADLENQISQSNDAINRKRESILEIDEELSKL